MHSTGLGAQSNAMISTGLCAQSNAMNSLINSWNKTIYMPYFIVIADSSFMKRPSNIQMKLKIQEFAINADLKILLISYTVPIVNV